MEHINQFAKVKKCVEKISGVDDAGNETASYEITLQFNDMNRGEYLRLVRAAILHHTVQVATGFPQAEMAMNVSGRAESEGPEASGQPRSSRSHRVMLDHGTEEPSDER